MADWELRTAVCSDALSWEEGLRRGRALHTSFEDYSGFRALCRPEDARRELPSACGAGSASALASGSDDSVAQAQVRVPAGSMPVLHHQMAVQTVRAVSSEGAMSGPPGMSRILRGGDTIARNAI
jgi:hypothetical protein